MPAPAIVCGLFSEVHTSSTSFYEAIFLSFLSCRVIFRSPDVTEAERGFARCEASVELSSLHSESGQLHFRKQGFAFGVGFARNGCVDPFPVEVWSEFGDEVVHITTQIYTASESDSGGARCK